MTADDFFNFFQNALRVRLPSSQTINLRLANNWIDLNFTDSVDFVRAVKAATGANLRCETFGVFKGQEIGLGSIDQCVIRIFIESQGLDNRLIIFLYELANISIARQDANTLARAHSEIKKFEDWLDQANG